MNTQVITIFTAHAPFALEKVSFFDLGEKQGIVNSNFSKILLNKYYQNHIDPFFKFAEKLFSISNGKFRYALQFTGTLIDRLKQYNELGYQNFKKFIFKNKPELVLSPYNNSLSALCSHEEFELQLNKQLALMNRSFGQQQFAFMNPGLQSSMLLAEYLKSYGIPMMFSATQNLAYRTRNHLYRIKGLKNFRVVPVHRFVSQLFLLVLLEKDAVKQAKKLQMFLNYVKKIKNSTITLVIPIEYISGFLLKNENEITVSEFMTSMFKVSSVQFETPLSYYYKNKRRNIGAYICDETLHPFSRSDYNELQLESIQKLFGLEEQLKNISDPLLLESWRVLQDNTYLELMSYKKSINRHGIEEFGFHSVYDFYTNYMNCIANIDIHSLNQVPEILN